MNPVVLVLGLSVALGLSSPGFTTNESSAARGSVRSVWPSAGSGVFYVQGRAVRFNLELWRDQQPGVKIDDRLRASLQLSTVDKRGLPTDLRVSMRAQLGRAMWAPTLVTTPTLVYDPKSTMLHASGGPRWSIGSRTTVVLEIRSNGRTSKVVLRGVPVTATH